MIRMSRDGPYLVSGGVPLVTEIVCDDQGTCRGWTTTRAFPARERYALCRCGRSQNPPFCDGAHVKRRL